jgi:hypothetical protein
MSILKIIRANLAYQPSIVSYIGSSALPNRCGANERTCSPHLTGAFPSSAIPLAGGAVSPRLRTRGSSSPIFPIATKDEAGENIGASKCGSFALARSSCQGQGHGLAHRCRREVSVAAPAIARATDHATAARIRDAAARHHPVPSARDSKAPSAGSRSCSHRRSPLSRYPSRRASGRPTGRRTGCRLHGLSCLAPGSRSGSWPTPTAGTPAAARAAGHHGRRCMHAPVQTGYRDAAFRSIPLRAIRGRGCCRRHGSSGS